MTAISQAVDQVWKDHPSCLCMSMNAMLDKVCDIVGINYSDNMGRFEIKFYIKGCHIVTVGPRGGVQRPGRNLICSTAIQRVRL